jgi:hypothetical protein
MKHWDFVELQATIYNLIEGEGPTTIQGIQAKIKWAGEQDIIQAIYELEDKNAIKQEGINIRID